MRPNIHEREYETVITVCDIIGVVFKAFITIAIIAVIAGHVCAEEPRISLDVFPAEPMSLDVFGDEPRISLDVFPDAPAKKLRPLWAYRDKKVPCEACKKLEACREQLKAAGMELHLAPVPRWVRELHGETQPILHWNSRSGEGVIHAGWPGMEEFLEIDRTFGTNDEGESQKKSRSVGYIGSGGRVWTGIGNTREQAIAHLSGGEHAGKFSRAWLETLSYAQLERLHANDHEGTVRWEQVVRAKPAQYRASCPSGRCPR